MTTASLPLLMRRQLFAATALMLMATVVDASPVVLDFESLAKSGTDLFAYGSSISEDGYTITISCCDDVYGGPQTAQLRVLQTENVNFAGSTALFGSPVTSLITLSKSDGGAFNLSSIELVLLPNNEYVDGQLVPIDPGPIDVTFEGLRANGKTVSQTIAHSNFMTLTTYSFQNFNHLVSVSWHQGLGGLTHQFDNVTVNSAPLPGTLGLLGIGLAGLALARRKKA